MPVTFYHKKSVPDSFRAILDYKKYLHDHPAVIVNNMNSFVLPDLYFLEKNCAMSFFEKVWMKLKMPSWLKKSDRILVFSAHVQNQVIKRYPFAVDKIDVVKFPVSAELKPNDEDARDVVRYQHTMGNAYFLYHGPIHPAANLLNLLKGFSIFKKKLGSNMKLVLYGSVGAYSAKFLTELETYKYRDDIIITGKLPQQDEIDLIASCYALVHPCRWDRFGLPVLKAMKLGVAVLIPLKSTHSEQAGMAGMYFNENNPTEIGEKMILIYRDEQMRDEMIGTGLVKMKNEEGKMKKGLRQAQAPLKIE
jgi:glycosyltransferase involved in cell wall biosynthesis